MTAVNLPVALNQIHDTFQLMLGTLGGDAASAQKSALQKILKITAGIKEQSASPSRQLPGLLQIESVLSAELQHYPVPGLTQKLLENIQKYKAALKGGADDSELS